MSQIEKEKLLNKFSLPVTINETEIISSSINLFQ